MATKLFLRNTTDNGIVDTGDGVVYDLITTAGAAADTGVVDTVGSGTNIQWTKTAGGLSMAWISGRVPSGGFTLTSADISAWLHESNNAANAKGRVRIYKYTPGTPTITELGGPFDDDKVELSNSITEDTWTANVTDTAFAENDRLLVRFFITNNGTMGGSRTATITFNAADAATGDSFINIAETVAFKPEAKLLAADSGSFAVSGTAASLEYGHKIAADPASYSFTGTAATLLHKRRVVADSATYTFTGFDATLTPTSSVASRIEVSWVEFVLPQSGTAITLSADTASFVFSGTAASLEVGRVLAADTASYSFTGTAASLLQARTLNAEAGSYSFTGTAASFNKGVRLQADAGSYSFSGTAATLEVLRKVIAESGIYLFSGSDAGLVYSAVTPEVIPTPDQGGAGDIHPIRSKTGRHPRSYRTFRFKTKKELDEITAAEVRAAAQELRQEVRADPLDEDVEAYRKSLEVLARSIAKIDRLEAAAKDLTRAIEFAIERQAQAERDDDEAATILLLH